MEYIEVVFNMGTSSTAEVPSYISITTQTLKSGSSLIYPWILLQPMPLTLLSVVTNGVMETDAESQADIRYEWVNQRLSYFEATAYANARGGHLACVGTQADSTDFFTG